MKLLSSIRIVFTAACVLAAALPLFAGDLSSKVPKIDSVLVSVNGTAVTLLDIILETGLQERELAATYSGERLRIETQKLRSAALENAVMRKLVWEEYLKKPFDVPKQEIENLLDEMAKNVGAMTRSDLEEKAKQYGTSIEDLRKKTKERIVYEVMLANLCDRQIYITPKEIYDAYQKNAAQWTTPGTIGLQLLQILNNGKEKPVALLKDLANQLKDTSEDNFSEMVKKYSSGLNADQDGKMDPIEENKLRPEFIDSLKNKAVGSVTGPVETTEGWYFIRIYSKEKAKRIPFSKASDLIREQLRRQEVIRARKEYSDSLRAKAVIRYHY